MPKRRRESPNTTSLEEREATRIGNRFLGINEKNINDYEAGVLPTKGLEELGRVYFDEFSDANPQQIARHLDSVAYTMGNKWKDAGRPGVEISIDVIPTGENQGLVYCELSWPQDLQEEITPFTSRQINQKIKESPETYPNFEEEFKRFESAITALPDGSEIPAQLSIQVPPVGREYLFSYLLEISPAFERLRTKIITKELKVLEFLTGGETTEQPYNLRMFIWKPTILESLEALREASDTKARQNLDETRSGSNSDEHARTHRKFKAYFDLQSLLARWLWAQEDAPRGNSNPPLEEDLPDTHEPLREKEKRPDLDKLSPKDVFSKFISGEINAREFTWYLTRKLTPEFFRTLYLWIETESFEQDDSGELPLRLVIDSVYLDEIRTRQFLGGVEEAVSQLEKSKGGTIHVTDAGCGPFPILAMCAALFSKRVHCEAIEVNALSAKIAEEVIKIFGLEDQIKVVHVDARKHKPKHKLDLFITETMITAFRTHRKEEDLLGIAAHFASSLKPEAISVPNKVKILAAAVPVHENSGEEIRERIINLRKLIDQHEHIVPAPDEEEAFREKLDSLKHELRDLEEKYPEAIAPDSPVFQWVEVHEYITGDKVEKITVQIPNLKAGHYHVYLSSIVEVMPGITIDQKESFITGIIAEGRGSYFSVFTVENDGDSIVYDYKPGDEYRNREPYIT